MKIGIAGAGAMGSLFAYFLNNEELSLYEKSKETVSSSKHGIKIYKENNIFEINPSISTDPEILNNCDYIFLFIKSYATETLMKDICNSISDKTIIITMQNGLGNIETISKFISMEKILYGTTSMGSSKINNNSIKFGGHGDITLGGKNQKALNDITTILSNGGLYVSTVSDPVKALWIKAIINAGINPIGAILSITNGDILSNPHAENLQSNIVSEAVDVANSIGIDINQDELLKKTRDVCEKTSSNSCSMLQDINAGRQTEIESINGHFIRYGEKNSINTSYNKVVYDLIKAKESIKL